MSDGDYNRRWYAAHRAAGLCAKCVRPAEKGRSLCAVHREAARTYDRRETERRKRAGVCQAKGCDRLVAESNKTYCGVHRQKARQRNRARLQRIKREVLAHYGNGRCACCGEERIEFLTIDHVHGGGTRHREKLRIGNMCAWLKQNNFPEGFQVLCMNCNFAKGRFDRCPHEVEREAAASDVIATEENWTVVEEKQTW